MVDILHRVGIKSDTEEVYAALTTLDGLAGWWTDNTRGEDDLGGVLRFRFGNDGKDGFDMKVTDLRREDRVLWEVIEGPPEWIGTEVLFELKHSGEYTFVLFQHRGWREAVELTHHCSTKWATFLMSLKQFVETGTGAPYPRDVKIDDLM
ncbi:SRPBCC family protein [Nocardia gipuzkoensis]